jgi:hypothetical protein
VTQYSTCGSKSVMERSAHFLVAFGISLIQTFPREKPSPVLQIYIILQLHLALALRPGWLVMFLLERDEGELCPHQLVGGVGLAHLPTLVLLMVGA